MYHLPEMFPGCLCVFFATPWTVASQAPLFMEFSRQEYLSGLPFPSPVDPPNPGIEPRSPELHADSLPSEPQWTPGHLLYICTIPSQSSFDTLSLSISQLLRVVKARLRIDDQITLTQGLLETNYVCSQLTGEWENTYAGKEPGEVTGISLSASHHQTLPQKESTVQGLMFWKKKKKNYLMMVMTMLFVNQENLPLRGNYPVPN